MFSKHDPRADALRAVHEGRATVAGTLSSPEWLIDDKCVRGCAKSYIPAATLPSTLMRYPPGCAADKHGQAAAIVVLGIFPARRAPAPRAPEIVHDTEDQDGLHDDHDGDRTAVPASFQAPGFVEILQLMDEHVKTNDQLRLFRDLVD